jgi:dienelactone hydrolase
MPQPLRPRGTARLARTLRHRRETLQRQRDRLAERPRLYTAIIVLTCAALIGISWPFTIAHLQAIAVLDLVANKPVPTLLRDAVSDRVTTTELTLPLASGPIQARLYTPVGHPNAPALVVLHGVHYLGMNEPRLIAFASAMASCGIRVLTPELPGIKDYQIDAHTIPVIGDSVKWLAEDSRPHETHPFITPVGFVPVGVMGLSFSGSLSLLAAANPEYRPYFKFVVAIGSEDEMSRVARFYRTGEDARPNGSEETLAPHEYGPLVIEYEHLQDFVPQQDLTPLRAVLRAHLYEDPAAEKAALAKLDPDQTVEAVELMDINSPITRRLLAAAETSHIQDMAGVSPHGHLSQLTTPVYLLHGEGDNIIPSAETQWMAREIPTQTLQASLISPVISHLDMDGKSPDILDQLRLVHFFALILHAAESP